MDHLTDDHGHSHGPHGHDHDHGHTHDAGAADYFLEQLLSLFVCGGFGVAAVLMERFGMLNELLAEPFHKWVVAGGLALLVFAAVRAAAVWSQAGAAHVHGPDCDHGHGVHDDHSHGGAYWRLIVLSFPLLLACMNLPNEAFIKAFNNNRLGTDVSIGPVADVRAKGGDVVDFSFDELAVAAYDPGKREAVEGRTVSLNGQFRPVREREFTLYKLKMNCCKADMIPLKARILPAFIPTQIRPDDWVRVTGTLQFIDSNGRGQYIPVVRIQDENGITAGTPEV